MDNEKILTITRYNKFGQEYIIASMNYSDLFNDEKFAKSHEILYDRKFDTITDTNKLKFGDIYYTESGASYILEKSLKGTYKACRLNRFKIDINAKTKEIKNDC